MDGLVGLILWITYVLMTVFMMYRDGRSSVIPPLRDSMRNAS